MASVILEKIAKALVLLAAVAAPWLLGYFPGAGSHWLEGYVPILAEYEAAVMLFQMAIVPAAACWLAAGILAGRATRRPSVVDVAVVTLLALTALSTRTSVYRHASLVELHRIFGCVLLFITVRALASDRRYRGCLVAALVTSCSLVALLGLRHYVQTAMRMGDASWREFGAFGNPNSFAGLLIMGVPLAAGLAVHTRSGPVRILCAAAAALMLVTVFTTGSKGGMLALFLALIFFAAVVVWPATGSSRARKAAVIVAALAPIVLALVLPPMRARITTAFTTQSHSGAFRYYTWKGTVRMIAARPWLGFGPGTFATAYPRYTVVGFSRMAHSKDLQVAAECGVPAAAALAVFFFAYFIAVGRRVLPGRSDESGPDYGERALLVGSMASVVAFGLHCLVDYDWYIPALALTVWLIMGLSSSDGGQTEAKPAEAPPAGRAVALCLGLAVLGVLVCSFPVRLIAAANLAQGARASAAERDFLRGQDLLGQAIALTPGNAVLRAEMSRVAASSGGPSQEQALRDAISWLESAAKLQPTEATYQYQLARLHRALEEEELAIIAADAARALSPCDTNVLLLLARLYEGVGRLDDSHRVYLRIDELWRSPVGQHQAIEQYVNLDYAYAWLHLARLAQAEGNAEELAALKQRATRLLDDYRGWARQQADMARAGAGIIPPDTASADALRADFDVLDPM